MLVVATANLLWSLDRAAARASVASVLAEHPHLVALQEWHRWLPSRRGLLASFGDYAWFEPWVGGCPVGARRDRFEPVARRSAALSPPGRADRSGRLLGVEPPRRAGVAVHRDRTTGEQVSLVSFHLASQVQGDDAAYRADRPRLAARHRREAAALARTVAGLARPAYACGDSNFHGFRLPGLVSAWSGREGAGGTRGARRIDDVHGPTAPLEVRTVETASDHLAVVATYA